MTGKVKSERQVVVGLLNYGKKINKYIKKKNHYFGMQIDII